MSSFRLFRRPFRRAVRRNTIGSIPIYLKSLPRHAYCFKRFNIRDSTAADAHLQRESVSVKHQISEKPTARNYDPEGVHENEIQPEIIRLRSIISQAKMTFCEHAGCIIKHIAV